MTARHQAPIGNIPQSNFGNSQKITTQFDASPVRQRVRGVDKDR